MLSTKSTNPRPTRPEKDPGLFFFRDHAYSGLMKDMTEYLWGHNLLDQSGSLKENISRLPEDLKKDFKKLMETDPDGFEGMEDYFKHVVQREDFSLPFETSRTESILKIPSEIVKFAIEDEEIQSVLDLGTGSGTSLFEYLTELEEPEVTSVEISPSLAALLALRAKFRKNVKVEKQDVLRMKLVPEYDLVVFDTPFGFKANPKDITPDQEEVIPYDLLKGTAAQGAFFMKAINAAKDGGTIIVNCPNGFLFDNLNQRLRKQMINSGLVKQIIMLPKGSANGTGILNSFIVMKKDYRKDPVEFINLQTLNINIPYETFDEAVQKALKSDETERVSVELEAIQNNDYRLNLRDYTKTESELDNLPFQELSELADFIPGIQRPEVTEVFDEDSIGVLTLQNVSNDLQVNPETDKYLPSDSKRAARHLLRNGDILMTSNGSQIRYGLVTDLNGRKLVPAHGLTIIRPKGISSEYLISVLNSEKLKQDLYDSAPGRKILHFTRKDLSKLRIPLLNEEQQDNIIKEFLILFRELKTVRQKYQKLTQSMNNLFEKERKGE